MHKSRLEAFTDGVVAIIITIMVLEIKVPEGETFADLLPLSGKFISYILSFMIVGNYWNNHHHTMQAVKSVNSNILWSNLLLLFCLSLLPFSTGWIGEHHFAREPMLLYGINLLLAAISYYIWTKTLIHHHGKDSALAKAFGKDIKGAVSLILYITGFAATWINPWFAFAIYGLVSLMWLIPDRRMERVVSELIK